MQILISTKARLATATTLAAILVMMAMLLYGADPAKSQETGLTAQVPENSASGASLGAPLQTTAGPGVATYSLSGPDAGLFDIDPETGEITLAAGTNADFESRTQYRVNITAFADLTVQVTNVDEAGSVALSTGSPESGQALTASLTDPDGGVSNVSWQWQRQDGDQWRDIAGANGASYTPGSGDIGHRLQAVATYDDAQGPEKSAQAATDNPVRNDPPEFGADVAARQVDENSPGGTSVGAPVTATDANGDAVSYSLAGNGDFAVDPDSGQLSVADGAALDFETQPSHSLTVTALDPHGDSDRIQVTVNLNNVDEPGSLGLSHDELRAGTVITAALEDPDGSVSEETWTWSRSSDTIAGATGSSYTAASTDVGHVLTATVSYTDGHGPGKSESASTATAVGNDAPAFPADAVTRAIDENQPAGTAAGNPVTATDSGGDTLRYSLTGSDAFEASLDGTVVSTRDLDFETQASHTVVMAATDPHGASARTTVTITVNNLDEPGALSLSNNAPKTGETITAALSDPDGDTSDETWQWRRGGANVPGANGPAYSVGADDLGHRLSVHVAYTDPQGAGKSAEARTDQAVANDPPVFKLQSYILSVAENAAVGTPVGAPLQASDPNGDPITYTLWGDGAEDFAVDADGQISVASALDHESRNSYALVSTASDPAGETDSMDVTITVTNVEETGTVEFNSTGQPEVNNPLTATLTDPDGNVAGETWTWDRGSSAEGPWTAIEGANGPSHAPTTQDIHSHLRVTVSYTDGHGAGQDTASAVTGLPVRPEPNHPPAFGEMEDTINLSVNHPAEERIGTQVPASDPNGDPVSFSMTVSPDRDAFTIESDTGHIRLGDTQPDEDSVHTLTVSISDGFGEDGYADTSVDAQTTITITMVNPNTELNDVVNTNIVPRGLWGDEHSFSTTYGSGGAYTESYDRETGDRLPGSFRVHPYNGNVQGATSHGDTVWVLLASSRGNGEIRAFSSSGERQSSLDITLHSSNSAENGIWTDGVTMYVGDARTQKLFAYNIESGERDTRREIEITNLPRRGYLVEIWSDGDTVWVASWLQTQVQAYSLANGDRKPELDLTLAYNNRGPVGMWSDGQIMYVMNQVYDTIFGYTLPR